MPIFKIKMFLLYMCFVTYWFCSIFFKNLPTLMNMVVVHLFPLLHSIPQHTFKYAFIQFAVNGDLGCSHFFVFESHAAKNPFVHGFWGTYASALLRAVVLNTSTPFYDKYFVMFFLLS